MDIKLMPEKYKKKGIGPGLMSPKKLIGQGGLWFVLTSILLIGTVLISLGLWGYQMSLNKEKDNLIQKFEELQSQRDLELEANFMELKKGIKDFKNILDNRIYSLNILEIFEEITLPQVQYSELSADLTKLMISLKTEAANYNTLAKQVLVFEEDSRIDQVGFSKVNLEKSGSVGSNLLLKLHE